MDQYTTTTRRDYTWPVYTCPMKGHWIRASIEIPESKPPVPTCHCSSPAKQRTSEGSNKPTCPHSAQVRPIPPSQLGGQFEGPYNPKKESLNERNRPTGGEDVGPPDYGKEWSSTGPMGINVEPKLIGSDAVPNDLKPYLKPEIPAAHVAASPQTDTSYFDQPNTFMRKLYEKYPHLYQILRETPPEELISRVFKDRFMSTYQIDYLHAEDPALKLPDPAVAEHKQEQPLAGPECPYKESRFGKKLTDIHDIKFVDDFVEAPKPDALESTYSAEISRLGNDIIEQQLYRQAALRKTRECQSGMKN